MRPIPDSEFLAWAEQHGIARSRRWPHAAGLVFPTPAEPPPAPHETWWTTWTQPAAPAALPAFVNQILSAAGADTRPLYLRAQAGWPTIADAEANPIWWPPVASRLLAERGLALPWDGAVELAVEEREVAAALLVACLAPGALNAIDLLPPDGGFVLATCHHDEVHGDFPSEKARAAFEVRLRAAGYVDEEEGASSASATT